MCYLSYTKGEEIKTHVHVLIICAKRNIGRINRNNDIGYLQGVGGKRVEIIGKMRMGYMIWALILEPLSHTLKSQVNISNKNED